MTDILPHAFAAPDVLRWSNPGAFVRSPETIFGESIERRTDGGGKWRAELKGIPLLTESDARLWEALLLNWSLGDTKIIVPRCAGRIVAGFARAVGSVPHSDGTPFSDGSLYGSGVTTTLAASVALRDTEMQVVLPEGGELRGAEPFTLVGPTYGPRLYGVARVLSVTDGVATVKTSPPAREPYDAGAEVDWSRPRCTMRAQLSGSDEWPEFDAAWQAGVSITFEETFR